MTRSGGEPKSKLALKMLQASVIPQKNVVDCQVWTFHGGARSEEEIVVLAEREALELLS